MSQSAQGQISPKLNEVPVRFSHLLKAKQKKTYEYDCNECIKK